LSEKSEDVRVVTSFGGGEYELGVLGTSTYYRIQTSLGPISWKYFESGDGMLEDAMQKLIDLALEAEGCNG
jgi:hypothetical protein